MIRQAYQVNKLIMSLMTVFVVSCTGSMINDHVSYDKEGRTGSSNYCKGYCLTYSEDGQTCVEYATNISHECALLLKQNQ